MSKAYIKSVLHCSVLIQVWPKEVITLLQCPQYSTSRCCLLQMFIAWPAGAMYFGAKKREHLIGYGVPTHLWLAVSGQKDVWGTCPGMFRQRSFSLSFFLTQFLHISLTRSFTDRNFDRTSVRSRSFRRLNRAFSVLRRTKSGTAVANDTSEERDNLRNANIPPEGKCMCLTSTVFGHLWLTS